MRVAQWVAWLGWTGVDSKQSKMQAEHKPELKQTHVPMSCVELSTVSAVAYFGSFHAAAAVYCAFSSSNWRCCKGSNEHQSAWTPTC